jgi:putative tryptophan/tyrosine transport system substrate-binding protein
MRRRNFIKLFGGAAATWSLAALAQQAERRIGVLNSHFETDLEAQAWNAAFFKRLNELGWIEGRNIRVDRRWGAGSVDRMQLVAKELVGLNPDVLLAITTPATAALQAETHSIPIVLRSCPIQSAVDSWRASRIRAATSPASSISRPR